MASAAHSLRRENSDELYSSQNGAPLKFYDFCIYDFGDDLLCSCVDIISFSSSRMFARVWLWGCLLLWLRNCNIVTSLDPRTFSWWYSCVVKTAKAKMQAPGMWRRRHSSAKHNGNRKMTNTRTFRGQWCLFPFSFYESLAQNTRKRLYSTVGGTWSCGKSDVALPPKQTPCCSLFN